jgi:predicted dehydrogenase
MTTVAESIGVAFVGCTHPHIFYRRALLEATPDVRLIGCYDPDAILTAALEQRYGLRAFGSAEALLDEPGVRFVIIEGWDTDNPAYARLAAQRGYAILLEKPGAPNLAHIRALIDDLQGKRLPFQVGYQLRYSPVLNHVRRIIESGILGPITLARFHAAAPVGGAAEVWQSVPSDLGGLVYTDGCHMIDLIIHLLGVPRAVKGAILKLPEGPKVLAHGFKKDTMSWPGEMREMALGGLVHEDAGAAILDYGDKLVTFDITGWEAHPWVESWSIEIYGADGSLYAGLQPPAYQLYMRNPGVDFQAGWHSWEGSATGGTVPNVNINYTREMEHMLTRIRVWDTDNTARLKEAEAVISVLDAIFRSHRAHAAVPIEVLT